MTTTDLDTITTTIRELEDRRYRAALDKDWDTFASLCHPALAYAHSSAVTDTLEEYLAKVRNDYYVYHDIEHPIDEIRVVGDVALVLGEMNAHITAAGAQKTLRNKCLAVWTNTTGSWLLLAYQPTPIPAPAPSPAN